MRNYHLEYKREGEECEHSKKWCCIQNFIGFNSCIPAKIIQEFLSNTGWTRECSGVHGSTKEKVQKSVVQESYQSHSDVF